MDRPSRREGSRSIRADPHRTSGAERERKETLEKYSIHGERVLRLCAARLSTPPRTGVRINIYGPASESSSEMASDVQRRGTYIGLRTAHTFREAYRGTGVYTGARIRKTHCALATAIYVIQQ